jgi:apolipoprotein N-acyltransferase
LADAPAPTWWRTWGLATLSGVLYFTGFAGFDQFYLTWIAFVPLLFAIDGLAPRRAFKVGAWMGLVTNLGGYYWLVGFMEDFSGFPLPLGILFNVILCSYQGLVFACFAWIVARGRDRLPLLWLVPMASVFVEFAYPLLFPSFTANSQHEFPLVLQIADLFGALGVSAVVVLFNAALFLAIRERRSGRGWPRKEMLITAGVVAATMVYGFVRIGQVEGVMRRAPKLMIGVAQSNMGIYAKWDDPREGLRRHRDLSKTLQDQGVDLLVWPESAYIHAIDRDETNIGRRVLGRELHTPLLFGALTAEGNDERERRIYNTAMLIDGTGEVQGFYDKTYLLAFGEYIPFGETFPILYDWSPNSSRFTAGRSLDPVHFGKWAITVLVCYEDILPGFTRALVRHAQPHLLVNMTNDAWFGDTTEPRIHLALAALRSVEHRRYMVRATNTGVSAFIDPVGRVYARGPTWAMAKLRNQVGMIRTVTIYDRIGDVLGWLSVLGVGWVVWTTRTPRGHRSGGGAGKTSRAAGKSTE